MSLKRILVVNNTLRPGGLEILQNCEKVKTTVLPYTDEHPDMLPALRDSLKHGYDGLIWNSKHRLTPEIMDIAAPHLKVVSTVSSGLDNIDLKALNTRGILLGCAKTAVGGAVADVTVGLLIAAARRFKEGVEEVYNGSWQFGITMFLGMGITGSTVGIVGLGTIGLAIVKRLKGFDVARFLYNGRKDKPEAKEFGAERVPLNQLLEQSDFVIICCPLSEETKNLINADTLKLMKKTSILVNVARGGIVDSEALYEALKEKCIFAAALDVTNPEPLPKDHKLLTLPNCYVTPHIGTSTFETRNQMARIAAKNIIQALEGKPMECPVTL